MKKRTSHCIPYCAYKRRNNKSSHKILLETSASVYRDICGAIYSIEVTESPILPEHFIIYLKCTRMPTCNKCIDIIIIHI